MKVLDMAGAQRLWDKILSRFDGKAGFKIVKIPGGGGTETNAMLDQGDDQLRVVYSQANGITTLPKSFYLNIGDASFSIPTTQYVDETAEQVGDLSALNTTAKTDLVSAVNEVKAGADEPFRVKKFDPTFNITVPPVTTSDANVDLPKIVLKIEGQEAVDYQIAGMIAYEVFDAATGGNRLNYIPVCQFTGQNQTELSVRGVVAGTEPKTARKIVCWLLLKHR